MGRKEAPPIAATKLLRMRARSILRAGSTLAVALTLAAAPARQLTDPVSGRGPSVVVASHATAVLLGTSDGTPDADLRPGDERDPPPPLPGSAAAALLLAGMAAIAFLVIASRDRLARTIGSRPHAARAPPASVTV